MVSYTTCWKLVQQGVSLSSDDWASALSISCTRLSAWLVFLSLLVFSLLVFSFTGFNKLLSDCISPYTEDDPRSQHLVVRPTVCSTHCSCATNVHLIPASGDDESIICPCRERGCVQVVLCGSFCLNMVLVTIRSNSVHSANRSSRWNYISRSHTCQG